MYDTVCVHGTYKKNLESILKSGLNRMTRLHVHFSSGLPTDGGVISGMFYRILNLSPLKVMLNWAYDNTHFSNGACLSSSPILAASLLFGNMLSCIYFIKSNLVYEIMAVNPMFGF